MESSASFVFNYYVFFFWSNKILFASSSLSLSLSQPITLIWYLKFIHIHRFIFVPIDSGNVYLRFLFRPNFFLRRVVSGVVMMIRQEIGLLKFPYLIFLRFKGLYICRLVRASWKLWILDRFRVFCDVASKLIDA